MYVGIHMKQADILLLIDAFDSDGDGRVSIQEFIEFIGMIHIYNLLLYKVYVYMCILCIYKVYVYKLHAPTHMHLII